MITRRITLGAVALAAVLAAGIAVSDGTPAGPLKGGKVQMESATNAVVAGAPAKTIHIGGAESAKWTATTLEAATTDAQKAVLKSGKPVTVTGEIVDVSCYMQLGKRGEAHVACGTKCIANGQPIGLLDAKENLYILFPEEHHPRRDGGVDIKKVFGPLLAKEVTVTGMSTTMHGYKSLFVNGAEAERLMESEEMEKVMKGEKTEKTEKN